MTPLDAESDPYLWLEDVGGARALEWVRERNAHSERLLEAQPGYAPLRAELREVLDSKDRIPAIRRIGDHLYNLWQDETSKRGLWRRTTLDEYAKPQPAWETVIDLDALGRAEGENWVWGGANCFGPAYARCIVALSRGGADAKVQREFDLASRRFVPAAHGGFELPEAKSELEWADADTLYVGTDFGAGSLTDSGYPRVIKRWKRGTPLAQATTVFEGQARDVWVDARVDRTPGFERTVFAVAPDFFTERASLLLPDGRLQPIDKPDDARLAFEREWLLLKLRSDWSVGGRSYRAGSLLAARADAYLKGERRFDVLFEPTATRSLGGWIATRSRFLLDVLDDVKGRVEELRWDGSAWQRREVALPGSAGNVELTSLHDELVPDDPLAERYLLGYTDFLTPNTLSLATAGSDQRTLLKTLPALFDANGMRTEQRFATSKDGSKVPYFVIWPRPARQGGAAAEGASPTLLYGYGGFEVSLQPAYSALRGRAWLARGGVFVLANLRGGGEFGPAWHRAAMKANKQKSYDDFIAVAEDLIATRVTTPARLGIMGGSNGGLLVGATFVQRPDLFNAVVCQVPLLDMRRYHKLLAGASWMAEYGNPELPAEWDWISRYSPYQNVKRGVRYPEVLFTTSTRDDRVHPGHARKMAARMLGFGAPVLYYENIEGGHGGAADNEQRAKLLALEYTYLWRQLGR
ncbi:MAG TPA: prolyl oligopeptidase family serine peptidase [Methylibium sp.]|uniref:prolyl oligopeptidase family serine peptidase n=1 Tax=Methylibium sp. TaxID=2067992 RepID=UPI002DBD828F|nr:prolyl oligopeptidase family serine peptidase [Methylibium sp.]HEU4460118.1 prolyl oligopeptidase family serine peptidase [Methylibium sp.]